MTSSMHELGTKTAAEALIPLFFPILSDKMIRSFNSDPNTYFSHAGGSFVSATNPVN